MGESQKLVWGVVSPSMLQNCWMFEFQQSRATPSLPTSLWMTWSDVFQLHTVAFNPQWKKKQGKRDWLYGEHNVWDLFFSNSFVEKNFGAIFSLLCDSIYSQINIIKVQKFSSWTFTVHNCSNRSVWSLQTVGGKQDHWWQRESKIRHTDWWTGWHIGCDVPGFSLAELQHAWNVLAELLICNVLVSWIKWQQTRDLSPSSHGINSISVSIILCCCPSFTLQGLPRTKTSLTAIPLSNYL